MKLPLASEAEVPRTKIVLYLLNPEHRSGKSKACFFAHHGFDVGDWKNWRRRCASTLATTKPRKRKPRRSVSAPWWKAI
ncbi:MAG TPA: hypothetical protein PLT00_08350 [Verrucomicrobiota bacterium]|nr:hypothetical protein [Verrucomicrobiota bacterium]